MCEDVKYISSLMTLRRGLVLMSPPATGAMGREIKSRQYRVEAYKQKKLKSRRNVCCQSGLPDDLFS
jgi:hypothetical protein